MKNNLFHEFSIAGPEAFKQALSSALKGQNPDEKLTFQDDIENLNFVAFHHPQVSNVDTGAPGVFPYKRGTRINSNNWEIVYVLPIASASEMNRLALDALMKGSTALRMDLGSFDKVECQNVINGIGLEYILTTFIYHSEAQFEWIKSLLTPQTRLKIHAFSPEYNFHAAGLRTQLIDGSEVTRCGGNSTQEIAFMLHQGHARLFDLMKNGLSVDDAAAQLKFRFGITGKYFSQIAKQRVFRELWSQIVAAYKPEHNCSMIAYCEAESVFLNKSLRDPYTNLLRLTTEGMSAVVGGIEELTLLPYDAKAEKPNLSKSQRLSTNISLILKEEAYLDKVIDPAGGAYALESLTETLSKAAWSIFQEVEKNGLDSLQRDIDSTRNKRIEAFSKGEQILIGINKFPNPKTENSLWQASESLSIGNELILERDAHLIAR